MNPHYKYKCELCYLFLVSLRSLPWYQYNQDLHFMDCIVHKYFTFYADYMLSDLLCQQRIWHQLN